MPVSRDRTVQRHLRRGDLPHRRARARRVLGRVVPAVQGAGTDPGRDPRRARRAPARLQVNSDEHRDLSARFEVHGRPDDPLFPAASSANAWSVPAARRGCSRRWTGRSARNAQRAAVVAVGIGADVGQRSRRAPDAGRARADVPRSPRACVAPWRAPRTIVARPPQEFATSVRVKPRPWPVRTNSRRHRSSGPYWRYPPGVRGGSGRSPRRS